MPGRNGCGGVGGDPAGDAGGAQALLRVPREDGRRGHDPRGPAVLSAPGHPGRHQRGVPHARGEWEVRTGGPGLIWRALGDPDVRQEAAGPAETETVGPGPRPQIPESDPPATPPAENGGVSGSTATQGEAVPFRGGLPLAEHGGRPRGSRGGPVRPRDQRGGGVKSGVEASEEVTLIELSYSINDIYI